MATICVIGMQWGDEGKGKIVDLLAEDADIVVRFQGGSNAGHTVVVEGKQFILHLLPSGILREDCISVLGNGVVIDPVQLSSEIDEIEGEGIPVNGRLMVSNRAHVVMPYHKKLDAAMEKARGEASLGTTLRGIGPCYAEKVSRSGVRIGDLVNPTSFRRVLETNLPGVNRILHGAYGEDRLTVDEVLDEYASSGEKLKPYVRDVAHYLNGAVGEDKDILFEGAQGSLLDLDFGTYPYVTSSNTNSANAAIGSGIPANKLQKIIGVMKAYTTRVGAGPFQTELTDATGDFLREQGKEYGATTGRPRRCGWLDSVVIRLAARINGLSSLAVTRLDILDELAELNICTHYRCKGERIEHFPTDLKILEACEPVYEIFPGWQRPTSGIRRLKDLPDNARHYLDRIVELTRTPISLVSVGPDRDETIAVD